MEPEIIPISKFKATCLALLKKVQKTGETIIVTRKGEPVAMVGPPPQPDRARTAAQATRNRRV